MDRLPAGRVNRMTRLMNASATPPVMLVMRQGRQRDDGQLRPRRAVAGASRALRSIITCHVRSDGYHRIIGSPTLLIKGGKRLTWNQRTEQSYEVRAQAEGDQQSPSGDELEIQSDSVEEGELTELTVGDVPVGASTCSTHAHT